MFHQIRTSLKRRKIRRNLPLGIPITYPDLLIEGRRICRGCHLWFPPNDDERTCSPECARKATRR